jgi:hypothetical protein
MRRIITPIARPKPIMTSAIGSRFVKIGAL